jgi:hypothetical protein
LETYETEFKDRTFRYVDGECSIRVGQCPGNFSPDIGRDPDSGENFPIVVDHGTIDVPLRKSNRASAQKE